MRCSPIAASRTTSAAGHGATLPLAAGQHGAAKGQRRGPRDGVFARVSGVVERGVIAYLVVMVVVRTAACTWP